MINFFRKIRQRLLTENKFSRYILYAIGEIVLVVIGILIALSINTWNEEKKNQRLATIVLREIRADMIKDIERIEFLEKIYSKRLLYFKKVDPRFYISPKLQRLMTTDTISHLNYPSIFNPIRPFRSITSSFDAMISTGSSNLITNRELFSNIQEYYKSFVPSMLTYYQDIRQRHNEINLKWSHVIKYRPYKTVSEFTDEHLIADLNYYYKSIHYYNSLITKPHMEILKNTVAEIDNELNK